MTATQFLSLHEDHFHRNRMVVGFTSIFVISAHYHQHCEYDSCPWQGVLDTTLCDRVCQ